MTAQDDAWMTAMRSGRFADAWEICDADLSGRHARGEPLQSGPRHLQHVWNGQSLQGKRVLIRCYHGLGDTVQFIRFVRPLRRIAKEVIVWVQPPLLKLVSTAAGVDRVLPLHDGVPDVDYDIDIEIMELAHALRVDAQTIPSAVPYLFAPAAQRPRARSAHERAVGLVWQAGDWDQRRSLPASLFSGLGRVPGVRLFSFQRGAAAVEAAHIPAYDISSDDVDAAAAALGSLDLFITVDTFLAHLAGALGVPTWLLLHAQPDWRWLESRSDSPWYPTMRLFRQQAPGDWSSVIADVTAALRDQTPDGCKSDGGRLEQTIGSDVRVL